MKKKLNRKILIIEDEAAMLRALSDKFTMEGFNVLEAEDGEQGLKIALAQHPDLILLDIIMPKMDGLTMLKKIREDKWGKGMPIMLLTNLNDSAKIFEAMDSGVYDYLVKSNWKLDDVVKKVKEKLGL